jgi:hypothetical protein
MLTFDQWLLKVDSLLALRYYGLTSADFEDYSWNILFKEDYSPEEAVAVYHEDMELSWNDGVFDVPY